MIWHTTVTKEHLSACASTYNKRMPLNIKTNLNQLRNQIMWNREGRYSSSGMIMQLSKSKPATNPQVQEAAPKHELIPRGLVVALAACVLLALLVIGAAFYEQQQHEATDRQTHQLYCDLAKFEGASLPLLQRINMTLTCPAR